MKKIVISMIIIFSFALIVVFAQATDAGETTATAPEGNNMQSEAITNYLIDNFEFANTWTTSMPRDYGIATLMRRDGGAADVKASAPETSSFVLGVKVEYFRTGHSWFSILPPKRIKIPGLIQELSVWVAGRNYSHDLSFYISDLYGDTHEVGGEKLNFIGWKNITAYVSPDIKQQDINTQETGIDFLGIRVDCDPKETRGKYFVYFDDLVAKTDMYWETYSDPDDPKDIW